ncbi:hypothetical protein [Deinococcus geothermalis]|uniref:hypothetical protein n=1 Tax=Deinococcus geothermalis TaxID=68909 RepID=UPI0023528429|nr:hypothetical protein [Deinococcus geothermalis]
MTARRKDAPRPYFAGVVIEGVPGGGTPEQAARLVAERLARYVARLVPPPVPTSPHPPARTHAGERERREPVCPPDPGPHPGGDPPWRARPAQPVVGRRLWLPAPPSPSTFP